MKGWVEMGARIQEVTFGKVLDDAMKLSPEEREMLADIIRRRGVERWRDDLAKYALQVKEDIAAGKYTARTVDEVIKDLEKSLDESDDK